MLYFPDLPPGYETSTLWLTPLNAVTATCKGQPDLVLTDEGWITLAELIEKNKAEPPN